MTSTDRDQIGRQLDQLLQQQLQRLRRAFLVHGLGAAIALPAGAILLFFLLDHSLRLPAPVRLLHSAVILLLASYGFWRFVRQPLRLPLRTVDMAVLLERQFPDLHQRLVSAVQLDASSQHGDLRNQSADMVQALLQDTAAAVQHLPLEQLLTARITARLWAGAAALMLVLAVGAMASPATAWAFVLRQLGLQASYPRATTLVLELPPAGVNLQREDRDAVTWLTLPAGADLHVSVLAQGTVPDEVFLDIQSAGGDQRSVGMTPRSGGRFRYVFHPVKGNLTFHARGGDDDGGDRIVEVRTVHPPAVAQIRATLLPPAYTREAPAVQIGGPIEGLAGTEVQLAVTATSAVQAASMVFLESGRRLELQPATLEDDSGKSAGYAVKFRIETSDRYQIELQGGGGLRSPAPGTYPISVLPDYTPVGRWLQPDDESPPMLLPGGVLCMRLDAHDDHGLTGVTLDIESAGKQHQYPLLPPIAADAPMPKQLLATELYEVKDLLQSQKPGLDSLFLAATLVDNCAPTAGVTVLPRRSVQIADPGQLAAAIARQFRSLREDIERALSLQNDRKARIEELLQNGGPRDGTQTPVLTGVEVGQGRIMTTAEQTHRQLMRAFDLHLWNRLETAPAAALVPQLYQAWFRQHQDARPFAPEFYRDLLARRKAGSLGAMETTLDPILGMVSLADGMASELAPQCLRLLAEAQVAKDQGQLTEKLTATVQMQGRIEAALQQLLDRLDDWNDLQDLIQETRALRDRQKEVQGRTEELRGIK